MWPKPRSVFAILLFFLAIAALAWAGIFSPSYQECYAAHERSDSHDPKANADQPVSRLTLGQHLWRFAQCEALFLNENNGAVTALATIAIAGFTLILWIATSREAQLTTETIALTRDEFRASHRPELVIHSVRLLDPQGQSSEPLSIQFGIINAGTGTANVVGSAVYFDYFPTSFALRPYLPELARNDLLPPHRMGVGASHTVIARHAGLRSDTHLEHARVTGFELFVMGWIAYQDGRSHTRTTFFCRQYRRDLGGRFVVTDDPDAEKTY